MISSAQTQTDESDLPSEGDLVRITFDRENGMGDPVVQGSVTDVDDDPDVEMNRLFIEIDEAGDNNQTLTYSEGVTPDGDESWAVVSRKSDFSRPVRLGTNAELEVL